MEIKAIFRESRTVEGERVDAAKILIDGGITAEEIETLKDSEGLEGFTGVLEHYVTLYKPPQAQVLADTLADLAIKLPDDIAATVPDIYPQMKQDGAFIKAGTRINWNGKLKRAAVDLWDRAEQNPDNAPNLWSDLVMQGEYRTIPDVITAALAFAKDEVGYWPKDGKLYRAKNNGTVWTPEAYPAAWEEVKR